MHADFGGVRDSICAGWHSTGDRVVVYRNLSLGKLHYCETAEKGSRVQLTMNRNPAVLFKIFSILSALKNRGVTDIFVACHDNLTGLCEAIHAVFPKTKNQLCIVHQIRSSGKFVPYKTEKQSAQT